MKTERDEDIGKGTYCRRCGYFLASDERHSWCLGPRAGHYCFGCEPAGEFTWEVKTDD